MIKNVTEYLINYFLHKTNQFEHWLKLWQPGQFEGKHSYTTFWDSTDTLETFKAQRKSGYNETSITYHINEYGFRTQTNKEQTLNEVVEKTIACFGCSVTFGVGLTYEETWPHVLQEMTQHKYVCRNYGISGASADTISRLVHNYLLTNKPKAVCCLLPDMFRRELFDSSQNDLFPKHFGDLINGPKDEKCNVVELCKKNKYNVLDWRAYKRLSGEDNSVMNYLKNVKFIESLCKEKDVPLFINTWDVYFLGLMRMGKRVSDSFITIPENEFEYFLNWDKMDKARDGSHLGRNTCKKYASLFYNAMDSSYLC